MIRTVLPARAAAVALLAALAVAGCQKKAPESASQQARSVSVVALAMRPIEGGVVASGSLVPREDVAVYSQINGYRVLKVLADEGAWVKAGQPMAQLDDTLLKAQLAQQTALAAQQKSTAARAEAEAARVKGLDKEGLLSVEQVQDRRFAADAARSQALAQEAAAADMRTRESLMVVRAPVPGLVIERNVRAGDMGGGTTPWFRIAQAGEIELAAEVPEAQVDALRPGDAVEVTLADGSRVQGVVRLVGGGIDPGTRLGRVRIRLPVRPDIRAGGFARATFGGGGRSVLAAPETAIRYDADGASVMTVGQKNKVMRTPVTTGQRGGGWVELLTGPPAGTWVVAKVSAMLVPGDTVRPVRTP